MSVSINQIVYEYLRFATAQQRDLTNIANEMSELNSRVTDVINIFANGDRIRNLENREVESLIDEITPSMTNDHENDSDLDSLSETINSLNNINSNEGEEESIPINNTTTRIRHRRSSIAILDPAGILGTNSRFASPPITTPSLTTNLNRPTNSPPPPPPPTIPPPIEIPTIRSMTRDLRQSPVSERRTTSISRSGISSSFVTSLPYRHRVFTFSNARTRRTVENPVTNLSPVRIRPSISQIRRGTELLTWRDISNNYQTSCPIDLLDFTEGDSILRIRECKHIFREMNLRRHFRNSATCPICRFDIRDYIPDNNAPALTSEDLDNLISNDIVNTIDNIVTSRAGSNRRNRSSVSLT
tara:strand:+ start:1143 stop:2213 length:1071 start_codon:yes stop_codon:yes gene_type:complete